MIHRHSKPKVKDVIGLRGYAGLAQYYTGAPKPGNSSLAKMLLCSETFENLTLPGRAEETELSCPAHELPAVSENTASPVLAGGFSFDTNNSINSMPKTGAARTPLSKTVNHFESPEDKTAAAIALRESTGGALSPSVRLSGHVERINAHLKTIDGSQFEIGRELSEIIKEKDFAEDTIEGFVKNTWGWGRQRAYELMEAYSVKAGLPENVINLLQNTGQAKALKAAPESKRAEVLSEVAASGSVTAKKISEKIAEKEKAVDGEFEEVKKPAEEILDDNGILVPEHLHAAWRDERATEQDLRMHALVLLERWPAKMYGELSENQKKVLKSLLGALAIAVCPACKGEKCKECHKRGIVSKRPLLGTVK